MQIVQAVSNVQAVSFGNYSAEAIKLQEAKDSIAFYLQGEDSGEEFKEERKMLKQ